MFLRAWFDASLVIIPTFLFVLFVLYLSWKQFKMKDEGTNELKKLEDSKAPGTLFTAAPTTSANEAFRRVQEDPLLRMR